MELPRRYHTNNLSLPNLDDPEARNGALAKLRDTIISALGQLESNVAANEESDKHDSFYTGSSGIAHLYLRLSQQLADLPLPNGASYSALIRKHLPARLHHHSPPPGKLSPIGTVTGPAIAELTFQILFEGVHDAERFDTALHTISKALNHACASDEEGGDEVLYGRAGLLWGALNLLKLIESDKGSAKLRAELGRIVTEDVIKGVVGKIINCGRWGAQRWWVLKDEKLPLLWKWHDKPYLGAIHGIAGILTVLLQCPAHIIKPHLPLIVETTTYLCQITEKLGGHLPSSLPARHRTEYTQICHGNPGLLLLLITLESLYPDEFNHSTTLSAISESIWKEGLLRKGLGLCHGAAGNALTLLYAGDIEQAVALLEKGGTMPPLGQDEAYRQPDTPWSLFEGAAGYIAACAEAVAVLEGGANSVVLGLPGLGGFGPKGML